MIGRGFTDSTCFFRRCLRHSQLPEGKASGQPASERWRETTARRRRSRQRSMPVAGEAAEAPDALHLPSVRAGQEQGAPLGPDHPRAQEPLPGLFVRLFVDLPEPPDAAGGLCPGLLGVLPHPDGSLRGVHVHRPAALGVFQPEPERRGRGHHRGGQPGDQGALPLADFARGQGAGQLRELPVEPAHPVRLFPGRWGGLPGDHAGLFSWWLWCTWCSPTP